MGAIRNPLERDGGEVSVSSESLRKLASLNLTPEQMAVVLDIMADGLEKEEKRKKSQAERTRKSRSSNVTVTLQSQGGNVTTPSPLVPPLVSPAPPSELPPIIPPTTSAQALPAWLSEKTLKHFRQHRNKIKKPMTDHAEELIILELEKLMKRGHDPTAVLEQSIRNGWQDVFEIKEKTGNYAKPTEPKKSNVITL